MRETLFAISIPAGHLHYGIPRDGEQVAFQLNWPLFTRGVSTVHTCFITPMGTVRSRSLRRPSHLYRRPPLVRTGFRRIMDLRSPRTCLSVLLSPTPPLHRTKKKNAVSFTRSLFTPYSIVYFFCMISFCFVPVFIYMHVLCIIFLSSTFPH